MREKLTIGQIMSQKAEDMTPQQRADLPRDFFEYKPQLYRNLAMPSYVHGYSLAIEYMRNWFLSHFDKNFFKVVHINGKHVLDDWKHFNNYNIKREKPMLAIVPTVEYDHDRETLDLYMADQNLLLKRSNFQQSFLKDYNSMTFLYMQSRALKMNFNFKVRVGSRAEQLDLYNKMEIWFRIGATQHKYISADFHIPYDIMLNIAEANHFEVKNEKIENINGFLSYINKHSSLPIMYKIRAINQKPEFFMRVKDLYTHISTVNKLRLDDGERNGKLDTNFHIEMEVMLTIPIPHFYVYFCQRPITHTIGVSEHNKDMIGIYSINNFEIPPENKKGWGRLCVAGYLFEKGEKELDLSSIIYGGDKLSIAYQYCIQHNISPETFLDIKIYRSDDRDKLISGYMDWEHCIFYLEQSIEKEESADIVIYSDNEFMNNIEININNLYESRIDT